ncbi:MAG: ribosome-binding factor A [Nitrospinae bacterium CG11_big_fil_rev_8_21_14_0_20_45_15]|jgi:ribosome-binding factor A|nr:MAG: ribosome-binding factor A [Nitrospinae bacterium CG11_big_fil_rev_8_21_14_0_20_45_15]
MRFKRSQRVQELLLEEISRLIQKGLKDPRVGFITITAVQLTDNLKNAKVFISAMGDKEKAADAVKGLRSAQGYIRRELGRNLYLRYIPELDFRVDELNEKAERIDRLLNEMHFE